MTAQKDNDPTPCETGPVLGVDLGTRRVGVAASDPGRVVASGLDTLIVGSRSQAVELVAGLAGERGVSRIVVGLPLNMNGSEGKKALESREFAELLGDVTGLPVSLWDERLTSVEALGVLGRAGAGRAVRKDKGKVDRVAVTILLQSYLDSLR